MLHKDSNLGSIPSISEEIIVDVAEVDQRCCLDESEQGLENVDQTYPVLASSKLVLQKTPLL